MRTPCLALAAALALVASHARADTIVETIGFIELLHGSTLIPYPLFDPSLGPLDEVVIAETGDADVEEFIVRNSSSSPVTTTATVGVSIDGLGVREVVTEQVTLTLPPEGITYLNFGAPYSAYFATIDPAGLAPFIGTGSREPDVPLMQPIFESADPDVVADFSGYERGVSGTETITYIYGVGATLLLPEPASVVMMTLGFAGAGAAAWRRRAGRA